MEVAGRDAGGDHEEQPNPRIEGEAQYAEQQYLAESTDEGHDVSDEVELGQLGGLGKKPSNVSHDGVNGNVQPAPDGVVGRILPGLQSIAMGEVMGRFPVIEGLVAVLDGGEEGRDQVGGQENIKGRDGFNCEGRGSSVFRPLVVGFQVKLYRTGQDIVGVLFLLGMASIRMNKLSLFSRCCWLFAWRRHCPNVRPL